MITPEILGTAYGRSGSDLTAVSHAGEGGNTFPAAFTQIAASTDYDASGIWVHFQADGSSDIYQLKLYAGAGGSETEFLHLAGPGLGGEDNVFFAPIAIPAGTRITAKSASAGGFRTARVGVTLVRGEIGRGAQVSRGIVVDLTAGLPAQVDCGAVANTKSGWVQLINSTSRDAKGFSLVVTQDISGSVAHNALVDLAVGGSGSERIIVPDWPLNFMGYNSACRIIGPIWTPIPAGSRIAARAQMSVTTADTRVLNVCAILWE